MTLYDYLALSTESQWDELWENGLHIDNYKSIDSKFALYALHKFFIEVELCITTDKILSMHPFKYGQRMNKYVDRYKNENEDS